MQPADIFRIDLVLGFVAWGLLLGRYVLPRLRALPRREALALIATVHSFRFFGLVFLLPGYVSPALPAAFGAPAAFGDLLAALLAMGALLAYRAPVLFFSLAWAFNVVGTVDLINNVATTVRLDLPATAGSFGAAYWIPVLYVPLLLITHGVAFFLLLRPGRTGAERRDAALRLAR